MNTTSPYKYNLFHSLATKTGGTYLHSDGIGPEVKAQITFLKASSEWVKFHCSHILSATIYMTVLNRTLPIDGRPC